MTFDEFRSAWDRAILASRMPSRGTETSILLDTLDRDVDTFLEPLGGQRVPPFTAIATVGFSWTAVHSVWALAGEHLETEHDPERIGDPLPPSLRIELNLRAAIFGEPLPMPSQERWAAWAREVAGRFGELGADRSARAWNPLHPAAGTVCREDGTLALASVQIHGWDDIELPGEEGRPGAMDRTLAGVLKRIARALDLWSDALAHLLPPGEPSRAISLSNTPSSL